ncbi:DNA-directed RNA polymerase II subunit [Lachnellula hyalina]|uniref:DNA-directed RNA polymerase II subunit RPB9 n=1 Tax=Lachnellula hyalina TaxID=1316788 RepID=A0A8H8RCD0_9HELO|nr:DNA-directed RNA polymerase II subunit [Lachnellula hyalina]TVY30772.1 DNA-directed RNA polymerase II subunit [Lachnellula hyalina]
MASPASSSGEGQKKNMEQITFRFCSECSNMLYPKEDPDTHRLQFACRTCQYSEEATSSCVFRNVLNNAVGETAGVTQDVGSDPTVGLPLCLLCGGVVMCEGRVQSTQVDELSKKEGEQAVVSLPRSNKTCPKCKTEDAVFFQSQQRSAETGMKLFYVCCGCGHIFS